MTTHLHDAILGDGGIMTRRARTPTLRSSECGRGTYPSRGCHHRGRTESRTPSRLVRRARRTRHMGRRPLVRPRYDQVDDTGAFRFGLPFARFVEGHARPSGSPWAHDTGAPKRENVKPDARGSDACCVCRRPPVGGHGSLTLNRTASCSRASARSWVVGSARSSASRDALRQLVAARFRRVPATSNRVNP